MKSYQKMIHRVISAALTGAMLIGILPTASAASGEADTKLHLSLPEDGSQSTSYIQGLFNTSVLGYGAVKSSDTTWNIEGPTKVWNGAAVSGETDYCANGNLQIVSAASVGGGGYIEDDGVFQFYLHDREDYDSTGERYDRQRIEIKSHDKISDTAPALAQEDDIYTYRWKFKLPENCYTPISRSREERLANFFHIFQLKAVKGGENAMPVATFTIEDGYLMFQHVAVSGRGMGYNNVIGDQIPLSEIEGKWLSAEVTVLYRDEGYIHVKLDDLESETELINEGAELDTWRRPELGEGSTTYESDYPAITGQGVRCKWGLYRKYIPDAYRLDPAAGGNSEINLNTLPSWWKEAQMWLGDLEVVREDLEDYEFPEDYDTGDYELPEEGEDLVEHTAPLDGGVDHAQDADIKVCSVEGSHPGTKMLDGDASTTWDTAKSMLDSGSDTVYWAALDLGDERDINKFMIQFGTTSNKLANYQVYWAGEKGEDAYEAITSGSTDDPLVGYENVWQEVEGVGYHPGVNKYVKGYQMNIFSAASGDFDALEDVRYLLLRGDVVHDNSQKSIKTAMFKAINTEEQPEIETDLVMGEDVAEGCEVKTSTSSEIKDENGNSYSPKRYTSEYLTDGDNSTVWATHSSQVTEAAKGAKYWAAIDLGEEQELDMFRILWGTVSSRITSYQIFYSTTATDYTGLVEGISKATNATSDPTAMEDNKWTEATEIVQESIKNNTEVKITLDDSISARYLLLVCDVDSTQKAGAINTASFEAGLAEEVPVEVKGHAETLGTIKMLPGLDKDDITAALLPERFSVELSNGTYYALEVEWDENDIDALDPDEPGKYVITGKLVIPEGVNLDFGRVDDTITRTIIIEEDIWAENEPEPTPDPEPEPEPTPDDKPSHSHSHSSSSSSNKNKVSIESASNGTVKADVSSAKAGDTVTITVKPAAGYQVDQVIVTDRDGDAIRVKDKGDGKYTFTMPNSKVTIEAAFVPEKAGDRTIVLTLGSTAATVFGQPIVNDVAPVARNNRTMLPIRFIAEALGARVDWDEAARKVTITRDMLLIEIYLDSDIAYVNGQAVQLDSPAFAENSRTYLPLRFIAENLGAQVDWIADTQTVIITAA